jgi:tellurite resistance protein TerC
MPSPAGHKDEPADAPLRARDGLIALTCILAGLGFGAFLWLRKGPEPAQQYLSGYLIELSLSVDNVFVFALVFEHFGVQGMRRRRLLFWGIAGAIVLRTAFIIAGVGAIQRFTWVIPVFGAIILATGIRLGAKRDRKAFDPTGNPAVRFLVRRVPAAFAALVALETADLIFALDSLPAVLAVTHDAFIAVASNLFAILGLRSLFVVVSGAMRSLRFLKVAIAAILSFVGIKMLAEPWYRIPTALSLAVIAAVLAASTVASLLVKRQGRPR